MGGPPPDVLGGARAVFRFVQHSEERANVMHVSKATDWTVTELGVLAQDLLQVWFDSWRQRAVDDMSIVDVTCTSLKGDQSEQSTASCLGGCAGLQTDTPAPGSATSTLSWRTTGIGRSKRGRSFVPGMSEVSINDDDTLTSARMTELAIIGSELILASRGVSGANLAVFSRVFNIMSPIVTVVLENILDSMRRRLPKRGR